MAKSKKGKPIEQKQVDIKATTETPEQHGALREETTTLEQSSASVSAPKDFESLYLQQVTAEFADDIDRLRNANDFTENSLPILIDALKQGACAYSEAEKRKVMGDQ